MAEPVMPLMAEFKEYEFPAKSEVRISMSGDDLYLAVEVHGYKDLRSRDGLLNAATNAMSYLITDTEMVSVVPLEGTDD